MDKKTVRHHLLAMVVTLIGLGDSIYLTVQHLTGRSVRCTITSTCSKVLSSSYATIAGIPTAAWGVLAYFAAFSLATLVVFGYLRCRFWLATLAGVMLTVTLVFLYLQTFVIRAFCEFCLLSAAMTFLLAGIVISDRVK
ncbi:MAG: vitamin K epoxide reductase family protein [Acidobacteria bacterium]|nr:vitamin K epoxide reductase family protein [Acidobacteriota bacterium]